jgi:hypothetical protein
MPDRWPATPETLTASLFEIASDELGAMGLVLKQAPGEYRVNSRWGPPATEYATDALQDAVQHDPEMAAEPPPGPAPPLGLTGRRSRRGFMRQHNGKIAARRRRRAANGQCWAHGRLQSVQSLLVDSVVDKEHVTKIVASLGSVQFDCRRWKRPQNLTVGIAILLPLVVAHWLAIFLDEQFFQLVESRSAKLRQFPKFLCGLEGNAGYRVAIPISCNAGCAWKPTDIDLVHNETDMGSLTLWLGYISAE